MKKELKKPDHCASANCAHKSTKLFAPVISLWAKGYKIGSHDPMVIKGEMAFCEDCKPHEPTSFLNDWFTPELRHDLAQAMLSVGKAAPNWASAKVEWSEVK